MRANKVTGIPCLVLTHGRDDINEESLASVIGCDSRLEIDVVHNPSFEEDGSFLRAARDSVANNAIRSLTVFDENISNNALLLHLIEERERYSGDYIVLTDGDILAPRQLIDEQLAIFENRPEVMACGLRIDASRWSDKLVVKGEAVERFNTTRFETEDYVNSATGLWMAMFRGPELFAIIDVMLDNGIRFTDGNLKLLGSCLFQKEWVATKHSIGRELNRERTDYHDRKEVSTKGFGAHSPEAAGSNYATWNHNLVAAATCFLDSRETRKKFAPLPPAASRFRASLEQDPVIRRMSDGALDFEEAYVVKHATRATKPGLALVLSDGRSPTGISRLPGGRSILFISAEAEPGPPVCSVGSVDIGATTITRSAQEISPLLGKLARLLGSGGHIKGLIYGAEAARRLLRKGTRIHSGHLPAAERKLASELAGLADRAEESVLDSLLARLWTDVNLARFAEEMGYQLTMEQPANGAYLTSFTLDVPAPKIPAARQSR